MGVSPGEGMELGVTVRIVALIRFSIWRPTVLQQYRENYDVTSVFTSVKIGITIHDLGLRKSKGFRF